MFAALSTMGRHVTGVNRAVNSLNRSLKVTKLSAMELGGVLLGAGIGMAFGLSKAVTSAAQLQIAMTQVQMATIASNEEMDKFYGLVLQTSHQTMFSMRQVASIAKEMAAVGIPKAGVLGEHGLLPIFSAGAEVLYRVKGAATKETVDALSAVAHQFGFYSPETMGPVAEQIVKLALRNPATLTQFSRISSYVTPALARIMGATAPDILNLIATTLQVSGGGGAGGRGGGLSGAAISDLFERMIPGVFGGGLLTGHSALALRALGFATPAGTSTVFDATQRHLDIHKALTTLAQDQALSQTLTGQRELVTRILGAVKATRDVKGLKQLAPLLAQIQGGKMAPPAQLQEILFSWAFGQQGKRVAGVFATPTFQRQLAVTEDYVQKQESIAEMQKQIQDTLLGRWAQFTTDLENLFVTFVYKNLPTFQKWIVILDDIVQTVTEFENRNPGLMKVLSTTAAITSGLMILGGALTIAMTALKLAMVPFTPGGLLILGLLAAATVAYEIYTHWNDITAIVGRGIQRITDAWTQFIHWIIVTLNKIPGVHIYQPLPSVPKGYAEIPDLSGHIAGYRKIGPGGIPIGPILQLNQIPVAPASVPSKPGTHSMVLNVGGIHITAQPGQSHRKIADAVITALTDRLHNSTFGTTTAGGTLSSVFLMGGS